MAKKVGYARVSTKCQAKDGNSLESQARALKDEGCEIIFQEFYTGTKMDRPEFTKCLDQLESGDTLVVTKLDRFARTSTEGYTVVKELLERGIKVYIINMGLIEDTPMGRMIFKMMAAFAEFERDMIVERTQEGRKVDMDNGVKMGRTRKDGPQLNHALALYDAGEMSLRQICEVTGVSKATLCRRIKERKALEVIA